MNHFDSATIKRIKDDGNYWFDNNIKCVFYHSFGCLSGNGNLIFTNKEKYLAVPESKGKNGRVFSFANSSAADARLISRLKSLYKSGICDTPTVVKTLKNYMRYGRYIPCKVSFRDGVTSDFETSFAHTAIYAGMVISAVNVCAKLSDSKNCTLTLTADMDSAVVEAECEMHVDCEEHLKSSDFDEMKRLLHMKSLEGERFENLLTTPDCKTEMYVSEGKALVRAVILRETDGDRLKFRDGVRLIEAILREFGNDSLDSEQQCQNQQNIPCISGVTAPVRCDNEYYGTEQEIVG